MTKPLNVDWGDFGTGVHIDEIVGEAVAAVRSWAAATRGKSPVLERQIASIQYALESAQNRTTVVARRLERSLNRAEAKRKVAIMRLQRQGRR